MKNNKLRIETEVNNTWLPDSGDKSEGVITRVYKISRLGGDVTHPVTTTQEDRMSCDPHLILIAE